MPRTALEKRYIRRRKAGKTLSPARTAPTADFPLGRAVKVTTVHGKPNPPGQNLWALGYHPGEDFACPVGSQAVATTWGTVIWAGERGGWSAPPKPGRPWAYGWHVVIRTASGKYDYIFAHLSKVFVKAGEKVRPGTVVGLIGATGNATGPHLHFEVRPAGGRYGSDVSPVLVRRA